MSYPQEPANGAVPSTRLGAAVALGAAMALIGAVVVGSFFGLTNYQSTYLSVLLGWLVGLVIHRASRELPIAAAAGMLALAGSALASLIGVVIGIAKNGHVPLSLVLRNMGIVFHFLPRIIGWFGFLCWALSGVVAFATVRRGRTLRRMQQPGSPGPVPGGMTYPPLAGGWGSEFQALPDSPPPDALEAPPS